MQEKLYLMGVVLTFHKFYTSFEALRADLSKGNKIGYRLYLKALNWGLKRLSWKMKGGTSDMLIEKTVKIKILEEVWAGIEEKAKLD